MRHTDKNEARAGTKATWSVVVLYEDDRARERAVEFCDQLVSRFWARFEFDVSWWPLAALTNATAAQEAAGKTARADLVAFSTRAEGDFPLTVTNWMETWLRQRGDSEGVLVGLWEGEAGAVGLGGPKQHYLRQAAHRGGMDYLTEVPQDIAHSMPESLDSYTQRADQVTHLLDGILHQQVPPRIVPGQ